jgi:transcriptional regulator with XRE-family HTH domain
MDINERVRMIIESHRLTAGAFAEKIGVQRSNVSHILSGRNKPGYEFLEKVLLAFPKVQADWLMTGRHKKTEADDEIPAKAQKEPEPIAGETQKKIVKIVTFYSDFTFDTYIPNAE